MFNDVQPDKSKYDLDSDKYIFKVVKLEADSNDKGPSVKWYFNVAHRGDPPSPIRDADTGELYEVWQWTGADLTPSTKAGTWVAALLQRPIQIGESGAKLAEELLGKRMLGLWGVNPRSEKGNKGILSVEPYKATANGKNGAKAAPALAPDPVDAEVAF